MEKIEAVKAKMHIVSLRSIVLAVSKDEGEKLSLIEDLTRTGCKGLLAQPWSLKSEEMAKEFSQERPNE